MLMKLSSEADYIVLDHCKEHIRELEVIAGKRINMSLRTENDHTINSSQYGWMPFRNKIRVGK